MPATIDVSEIRTNFGVNRRLFSRMTGCSERSISDWERGKKRLAGASLNRMREIKRLYEALASVMDPEFIGTWVDTPNDAFDGLKPLEVIERGEIDRLWRMIFYLESGVAS